jgi:hypothetical protein
LRAHNAKVLAVNLLAGKTIVTQNECPRQKSESAMNKVAYGEHPPVDSPFWDLPALKN